MKLWHLTSVANRESITREGISPAYSQTGAPEVWLCHPDKLPWAAAHVVRRHRWLAQDVLAIEVNVQKGDVTTRGSQLYTSKVAVAPDRVVWAGLYYVEWTTDVDPDQLKKVMLSARRRRKPHPR